MDLGRIFSRAAGYWPQSEAVVDSHRRMSFRELEPESNRLANGLMAMGIAPGSHVAIQAANRCELVVAEIALYKAGMVKVPVNARLSPEETRHVLDDSESAVLLASARHAAARASQRGVLKRLRLVATFDAGGAAKADMAYADLLARGGDDLPDIHPADSDLAVLHYTSGSSGVLKAAMQSFGNRKAALRKLMFNPGGSCAFGERNCHVGPVTHASGMSVMPTLAMGGCNILLDRFDVDELLDTIERERVTRLFLVPTMVNRIVSHPGVDSRDLSSLTSVIYGAAPMAPALVERAFALFGPVLSQGYGAGEMTSRVTVLTAQDHIDALNGVKRRLAGCGRAYGDTDVRVEHPDGTPVRPGEVGEIVVRGDDVMQGYWRAPELTAEVLKDGAYYSGDLATVDDEGFIYVVDRKKDMIISGGFNIYPVEVERVLHEHPAIYEVCVIGVPDEEWGERVHALVVLREGASADAAALDAWCRDRLPGFKRPCGWEFVPDLPKNPNGKIVRRQLRDRYWKDRERQV